ncbi:hypothetical protein KXV63_007062, partial [Aspergillus fumigatus]
VRKTTPLAEWAKKIAKDQQSVQEKLVYFRPINYRNHFTLLEINTREGVIRHYDSLAVGGIKKTVISRLVKKEFGSFGFRYEEAVRNSATTRRLELRYQGYLEFQTIVLWDSDREERLNPEPMLLEIVEGMEAAIQGNAMRKYR